MSSFDLIVIGSGPGGYRAAVLAALRGQRVAIVEKADWGGCCLNRGCVPKKDWHHSAKLIAASRHLRERGIDGALSANLQRAWAHQERVVQTVQDSYVDYMKRLGISAIRGQARFTGPASIVVEADGKSTSIEAEHFVVATGSTAHVPAPFTPMPGRVLTTDMLFDAPPPNGKRVAVIGSGIVGTEFAFILAMLGCDVVWLAQRAPLSRTLFSAQALGTLKTALNDVGVATRTGVRVSSVETGEAGVRLVLSDNTAEEVDWILLGTGRRPYVEGLDLAQAGIETNVQGFVRVDAHMRTSNPAVYAIGDCVSEHMTANQALRGAAVAVDNIIDGHRERHDPLWVPEVVYSAVELARIGLNEDLAEDGDHEPAVGFAAFETSPRALGQDETRGFVRLLADMDDGLLLGGEVVGDEAGELIHLLALAPDRAAALRWLAHGAFNHPARAEEFQNATETLATKWNLGEAVFGD